MEPDLRLGTARSSGAGPVARHTTIIRPLLAFPIIIYFWKVIVWDKVLGFGTTDPITGMMRIGPA